ncbi:MAG: hypothetical protein HQK52_21810 [Oligoflexia bacterium]|nr:hypothetical protein [Oligoflexia bacterium]
MKIKKIISVLCKMLLLIAFSSMALADVPEVEKNAEENKVEHRPKKEQKEKTPYYGEIGTGYYYDMYRFLEAEAGICLSEKLRVGLNARKAGYDRFGGYDTMETLGARGRFFLTKTFNLSSLVNYRRYRYDSSTAEEKLNDLTLSLSIGNMWQFEHFFIGADWIGIDKSMIVFDKHLYEFYPDSEKDLTAFKVNLLQLYLGIKF